MPQLLIAPFITLPRKKWKNQLEKKTRVIVEYEQPTNEDDEGGDEEVPGVSSVKSGTEASRGRDYAKSSKKSRYAAIPRLWREFSFIIHTLISILNSLLPLACKIFNFDGSHRFVSKIAAPEAQVDLQTGLNLWSRMMQVRSREITC